MYIKVITEGEIVSPIHIGGLIQESIEKKIRRVQKVVSDFEQIVGKRKETDSYLNNPLEKIRKLHKFVGRKGEFLKDTLKNPIIPGSSIKGSFASAIEHYKGWKLYDKNNKRQLAFQNIEFRDVHLKRRDLARATVIINDKLLLNNIEVLKPGTKFNLEIIYKESPDLRLEEVLTYPTLKTLRIINLIIKKRRKSWLPTEVIKYYNSYLNIFRGDFSKNVLEKKFDFIKRNGLMIRLGKYTGKLAKITLSNFEKEYNNVMRSKLRYAGRKCNGVLMGFVKLKILNIIKQ